MASEVDLDVALAWVLERARILLDARYAAVGILDRERLTLAHFITSGLSERAQAAIEGPPQGRGVLGLLIEDRMPLRIHDLAADHRSYGFPQGHPTMHDFLGVPILIDDTAWGDLFFTEKRDGTFDHADEYAAIAFAERVATLVQQNQRLDPD